MPSLSAPGPNPADLDDEMEMLEATFQNSTVPHDEEVEVFAKYLDDCVLDSGTPAQKLARIFKLVESYSNYVNDRAQSLRKRLRLAAAARAGSAGQDHDMDVDEATDRPGPPVNPEDLEMWELESQTWDLLRRVLPLRYGESPRLDPASAHGPHWVDFMDSVAGARENKAVLEWLQWSAASTRPDVDEMVRELQQNADRGDILAHGWLHTRTAIKMYKTHMHTTGTVDPRTADSTGSNLKTPSGPMVTQLDPDVVARQGRRLAPQDEYFERAIWLGCYELLRRGYSLAKIRDWCQERTEAWRAVSISGLPLSLDAPLKTRRGGSAAVLEDPMPIILWKRMCSKLAREGGADEFERAVYGILAGDKERVEAVGESWDDSVFAHYNAQLRAQYDHFLLQKGSLGPMSFVDQFGAVDLPGTGQTVKVLLARLENRTVTAAEATKPAKVLHSSILTKTLDEFLDKQGAALADDVDAELGNAGNSSSRRGNSSPPLKDRYHWIRSVCHVQIVLSALDAVTQHPSHTTAAAVRRMQGQEHIVMAYISLLRRAGLDELVPLYCSKLTGDDRYIFLSRNLIHVANRDAQFKLLNLAQRMGLDVMAFIRIQPKLYLQDVDRLVQDSTSKCPALQSFRILSSSPPTSSVGRIINPGVLGNDPEDPEEQELDEEDERLIRSVEWMTLIAGLVRETFDYGVRIYKYFFKYQRLMAARALANRVSCADILRQKSGMQITDEEEPSWWDEHFSPARMELVDNMQDEPDTDVGMPMEELAALARPFFELECAIRAIDCLETTAQISRERSLNNPARDREVANTLGQNAQDMKGYMKPLLKEWLLTSPLYPKEFALIREAYLPELVIGYASTLHVAGMTATRDFLLECMDLAALIAEEGSDLADILVRTGRMKELLESFASCSKALAIQTTGSSKKGQNLKKYRESGRSLELWTVRN